MTDLDLDSTLKKVFLDPRLDPIKKFLFISHRSIIRILNGNSVTPTDLRISKIHLLRSLPHRHFWYLLPKTTIQTILDRNIKAFYKDFSKCAIKEQSSIYQTFVKLLLVSTSLEPDVKEFSNRLWNILWLRREFLLYTINYSRTINGKFPLSFKDSFFNFAEFSYCAPTAFQDYLTNSSINTIQMHPRFDFSAYSNDRFTFLSYNFKSVDQSSISDDDLTEIYGRSVYSFHRILTNTQLPESDKLKWSSSYCSIYHMDEEVSPYVGNLSIR